MLILLNLGKSGFCHTGLSQNMTKSIADNITSNN